MAFIEWRLGKPSGAFFQKLLLLALYGFAFSLLLGRGTYEESLYLTALAVAGMLISKPFLVRLDQPVLAMLGFGLVFLVQGWVVSDRPTLNGYHAFLVWSLLAAAAITLLPDRVSQRLTHRSVVAVLLVLFVIAQVAAFRFQANKAGLFSNIHYLALYTVITLPILFYLAISTSTAMRLVFVLAMAGDFWLLMQSHSRPGYLALLAAALVTVPLLSRGFRGPALAAILLVPSILYVTGLFGFAATIDDLTDNFGNEERPLIWRETLELQMRSSWWQWGFGHGTEQFFRDYRWVSSFSNMGNLASPHNFFLELLYSHGITGLIMFLLAYSLFYGKLIGSISARRDNSQRRLGILLVSVATAHFVLGFFTLPFFSRHNLHPLSLILGAGFRYIGSGHRND